MIIAHRSNWVGGTILGAAIDHLRPIYTRIHNDSAEPEDDWHESLDSRGTNDCFELKAGCMLFDCLFRLRFVYQTGRLIFFSGRRGSLDAWVDNNLSGVYELDPADPSSFDQLEQLVTDTLAVYLTGS